MERHAVSVSEQLTRFRDVTVKLPSNALKRGINEASDIGLFEKSIIDSDGSEDVDIVRNRPGGILAGRGGGGTPPENSFSLLRGSDAGVPNSASSNSLRRGRRGSEGGEREEEVDADRGAMVSVLMLALGFHCLSLACV